MAQVARKAPLELPRRRRAVGEPLRKATFQLRASVLHAIKGAVATGAAPSANALVEQALDEKLRELRRSRVYAAYARAAQDQQFMEDMRGTTDAFDATVSDGLGAGRDT